MDKPVIDDELRKQIEPLPPQSKPRREKYLGCRPVADRAALSGIVFVTHGAALARSTREMDCGSDVTCWRRLRDRQEAGAWDRLHELLLAELRAAGQIDFSRVILDLSSVRAIGTGQKLSRTP